jgi:RNA polymerase sigma-70 factor (ECF subfamily)
VIDTVSIASDEDVRLLRRAATGDWASIGALYDRHRDGALAVAISVLADPIEAEDVVHDVFADLPRMARTYDPSRGRPEQWLCRSVRNRAIDHVRRRARRQSRVAPALDGPESLLALVPSRAASPAEIAEAGEFLELLGRLDPRHAHLVRLAFVDGWSHSAIARITGLPLGTVKTRLRNSVRQIGEMLAQQAESGGSPPTRPAATPIPRLVIVSEDEDFSEAARRGAGGLARTEVLGWREAGERSAATDSVPPTALIVDLATAETPVPDAVERLARHGWDAVPLLARMGIDGAGELPHRRGRILALGGPEVTILPPADLAPAALTASQEPALRARATARLMRTGRAFLAGDRLGRVHTVAPAAAALLGRSVRQLEGVYVTDLSADDVTDAERRWQALVACGSWSGVAVVRRPRGAPAAVVGTAWMTPDGFVAALAPDTASSAGAA